MLASGFCALFLACDDSVGPDMLETEVQALAPGWQADWGSPVLPAEIQDLGDRSSHRSVCGMIGPKEWDLSAWEVERIESFCDLPDGQPPRSFIRLERDGGAALWLTTTGGLCPDESRITTRFSVQLGDTVFVALDDAVTWDDGLQAHALDASRVIVAGADEEFRIGSQWIVAQEIDDAIALGQFPDDDALCPVEFVEDEL